MGVIVRVSTDGETASIANALICLNPADLRLPIIVVLSLSLCRSGCLSWHTQRVVIGSKVCIGNLIRSMLAAVGYLAPCVGFPVHRRQANQVSGMSNASQIWTVRQKFMSMTLSLSLSLSLSIYLSISISISIYPSPSPSLLHHAKQTRARIFFNSFFLLLFFCFFFLFLFFFQQTKCSILFCLFRFDHVIFFFWKKRCIGTKFLSFSPFL